MDPMDILGGLLGGGSKKSGGSLSGKILKDLLGGGSSRQPAPQRSPRNSGGHSRRPRDIDDHAKQLEDLLGVAKDRHETRTRSAPRQAPPPQQPRYQEPSAPSRGGGGFSFDSRPPVVGRKDPPDQNEEAMILIRAMINAAKSDGSISRDEQEEILQRISNPTQDAMSFLRQEFSSPLDVREFAWSVPIGMEEKVYTLSLAAIDLDANKEASYLRDLAHGLRLEPEYCKEIHQRYGAPEIH